ncbi:MAG: hypothetical protein ACOX3R_15970 [Desulfitobacteriia bacterium]
MKRKHWLRLLGILLLLFLTAGGCKQAAPSPTPAPGNQGLLTSYVGSEKCKGCHGDAHQGFSKTRHYDTASWVY